MIKYSQYKSSNKILNFDLNNFMPVKQRLEMVSGLIKEPKLITSYYKNNRELVLVNQGANYGVEVLSDNSMSYHWPYLFAENEYIAKGTYEEGTGNFQIDSNLFLVLCYLSGLGMVELSTIFSDGSAYVDGCDNNGQMGLVITPTQKKNTNDSHTDIVEKAITTFQLCKGATV